MQRMIRHHGPSRGTLTFVTMLLTALTAMPAMGGGADEVVVRPEPAPGPLDNPLKGWCPYTIAGPIHQPYSMVFLYVPWKDLEPREGEYAFDAWERSAWNVEAARGKHVVFRVFADYPNRPGAFPDWLVDAGIKTTAYDEKEVGKGTSPDYNDPRTATAMERLIAAMGKRYNADPRVAFIQVGLLGFWGEMHTWPRAELYASADTERRIIDAYRAAFPDKIVMARYAGGPAGEQPWLGFHDDMFPEDTDNGHDWSFLAKMRRAGRTDNWQRAAVGGEMVPHAAERLLGPDYELTSDMLGRAHFTWVGPYCPALVESKDEQFRRRSEEMVRAMGYEYRLTEIRHPARVSSGGKLTIDVRGANDGVAPFYYPWPVMLALLDDADRVTAEVPLSSCDIRRWLPGPFRASAELTFDVPPGRYRLALGIRDPWTKRPAIRFANELPVSDGWTIVSGIEVTSRP
jgi:hypothetical protein